MEEELKRLTKLSEDNQEDYDDRFVEDMMNRKTKIIGVKFESKYQRGTFEGREYSYFTKLDVKKGDIVDCPTKFGPSIGMVTRTDIKEEEIEKIKDYMKNVLLKYNREAYLQGKIEVEEEIR